MGSSNQVIKPKQNGFETPLRPKALMNYKKINDSLAQIVGNFWQLIWSSRSPAIEQRIKYLLSLSNAVGARRFRQATRELLKTYAAGTTVNELDELFCLFVWNHGAGEFSSEIGPSPLYGAYQMIKEMENSGKDRATIVDTLKIHFGDENPKVGTSYRKE